MKISEKYESFDDQKVENFSEVFELLNANIDIVEKLINPLLNGYGWSEGDKKEFFQGVKNRLKSHQKNE